MPLWRFNETFRPEMLGINFYLIKSNKCPSQDIKFYSPMANSIKESLLFWGENNVEGKCCQRHPLHNLWVGQYLPTLSGTSFLSFELGQIWMGRRSFPLELFRFQNTFQVFSIGLLFKRFSYRFCFYCFHLVSMKSLTLKSSCTRYIFRAFQLSIPCFHIDRKNSELFKFVLNEFKLFSTNIKIAFSFLLIQLSST